MLRLFAEQAGTAPMAYYTDLFTPETWEAFRAHGATVSGFRERQSKTAERLQIGYTFLCYIVRLSRWCGILRIASRPYVDNSPIFGDPDPFPVRFKVEGTVILDVDRSIPIFEAAVWNRLSLT